MKGAPHLKTGQIGEVKGVSYLKGLGYKILETNYQTPLGEIDCILKDKKTVVFIEIKTRKGVAYGFPEEAVHEQKQQKIARVAQWYLKSKGLIDKVPVRFDVLAVLMLDSSQFGFNHIKNAFEIEPKENI